MLRCEKKRNRERERGREKNQKIYNKIMIKNRRATFYREKKIKVWPFLRKLGKILIAVYRRKRIRAVISDFK